MIITDQNRLRIKSRETDLNEAFQLGIFTKLEDELRDSIRPGVGLAAVQIGFPIRALIIRKDIGGKHELKLNMVNPEIEESIGIFRTTEGCLSLPGVAINTERAEQITVKWLDYDTKQEQRAVFYGMESVIVQHEINHLDGILIIDLALPVYEKVGRNEPCSCNSGKKFKKCCGR